MAGRASPDRAGDPRAGARGRSVVCSGGYPTGLSPGQKAPAANWLGSESAGGIVDAQDRHFGRGRQDFAKRMHPLAGILAAELIELVEILHLDLELQSRPAVAAGQWDQQARPEVPSTRRLDLPLDEVHRALPINR